MPKEITHFTLADRIQNALPEDSLFKTPARKFPYLFLTGSISPDIPFFYIAGANRNFIQALSHPFHGLDRSALLPVLHFLNHYREDHQDALAYASGVVCHILTDTVFHPLVSYFSGCEELHKGATVRHRQFETAMDYYFWSRQGNNPQVSLARVIEQIEIPKKRIAHFIAQLFNIERDVRKRGLKRALKIHMTLQYLCRERWSSRLFRFMHHPLHCLPSSVEALFYPYAKAEELPFFEKDLNYRNPWSGIKYACNIKDLAEQTTIAAKTLFDILESHLVTGQDMVSVLTHPDLPEIQPGISPLGFRYWKEVEEIKEIVYSQA
jgi:hypothetical protein